MLISDHRSLHLPPLTLGASTPIDDRQGVAVTSFNPMESQITNNVFCTYTGDEDKADTTIFFISGNPGLISYYHPFLSLLAQQLAGEDDRGESTPEAPTSCRIYGCSLGGFEITEKQRLSAKPSSSPSGRDSKNANGNHGLYDLEGQISFVQEKLNQLMKTTGSSVPGNRQKVILIGHSVGTYMAMEILRRHREAGVESQYPESSSDFDIIGGIMLFPTVMDISASPSGQKLTV